MPSNSETSPSPGDDARRGKIYLALLLGLVVLAFSPSLRGGFVFDDEILIVRNGFVHELSLGGLRQALAHATFENVGGPKLIPYYRPLTMISYAVDHALGGGTPLPFRLTNLFLHLAATALVFRALLRYLKQPDWAALGTAWFALHPARAESVAWISGRPDSLCLVFLLLATWSVGGRLRTGFRVALFGCFATLAFLSKEMAVVLPLFVLVELHFGESVPLKRGVLSPWFFGALGCSLGYALLRTRFLPLEGVALPWDLGTRVGFILATLGREFATLLAPIDLSLHGASLTTIGKVDRFSGLWAIVGGASVFGVALAAIVLFRLKKERVAWALVLATLSLVPIANFVPMPGSVLTSPRLLYIPQVLFALALGALISNGRSAPSARTLPLVGGLAGALAIGCGLRAEVFTDNRAFWANEFDAHPDIPVAVGSMVRQDLATGKGEQAIVRALCGARFGEEKYPRSLATASVLVPGIEALAIVTPDSKRADLLEIRKFTSSLAEGKGGRLARPIGIEIPAGSILAREFVSYRAKLRLLALDISVRLGEADARAAIAGELAHPPKEAGSIEGLARVALRARDVTTSDAFVAKSPRAAQSRENLKFVRDLVVTSEERIATREGNERLVEEIRLASSLGLFAETLRFGRVAFGSRFETLERESPLAPVFVESALHASDAEALEALGEKFGTVLSKKEDLDKTLRGLEKDLEPGGCRFRFDPR